jgi:HlyD family secretion protein
LPIGHSTDIFRVVLRRIGTFAHLTDSQFPRGGSESQNRRPAENRLVAVDLRSFVMPPSTISPNRLRPKTVFLASAALGLIVTAFVIARSDWSWSDTALEIAPDDVETVRRVSLNVSVNAPGVIESASNTRVDCEIERLELRVQGRSLSTSGATRILSLVPDGTRVKKGDVICRLDSSQFEEMVRTQQINVERAKAEFLQAQMELDVAKISLEEYRNGTAKQQVQTLRGQIALAQTDSTRLTSRLDWARKMFLKGYLSRTAIRSEEFTMQRSDIALSNSELALKTFERFTRPKLEHQFKTRIIAYERELASEENSLKRFIERLKTYEKMIEKCTIRAPHDGMLVHANDADRNVRIEEGADVRQGQTLFYLPDLDNMQVMARLSESVVQKVSPGMKAIVEIESIDGKSYQGKVERISQFPIMPSSWRSSQDVKNYFCVVRILDSDAAARPGLNAEVQVLTGESEDSIVLSPDAVKVEGNKEFCFVYLPNGRLEKREIRTRTGDPASLEILDGLKDGETVLRSLRLAEKNPSAVVSTALLDPATPLDSGERIASESADAEGALVLGQPVSSDADSDLAIPATSKGF